MKKLIIIALLLVLPLSVFASDPKVLTVTVSNTESTVSFEGTTEDEVHAVMCKIYDSKDEEVDMLSVEVSENKFTGSFDNISNGSYVVRCARYEGGEMQEASIIVNNSNNPKTLDKGIVKSAIILTVSVVGVAAGTLYLVKKKKAQKE